MGRKKDRPTEIPIKFVGRDDTPAETEAGNVEESEQIEQDEAIQQQVNEDIDPPVIPEGGQPSHAASNQESELNNFAKFALEMAEVQDKVEALTREKAVLYDQVLRRQAEFENFRKRVDKEKTEFYQRTRAEILLELLPVLDNFDRALLSLGDSEGDRESLRQGIELIHRQFSEALKKLGLQPVEAIGQVFDPHIHEAVTVEPTDKHEENTIIEEFERGYRMGDRLLRPAKVKVAAAPEN